LGGREFLKVYFSAEGGFQNRASYTGETDKSWVTRFIHAGKRSMREPFGSTIDIF